MRKKSTELSEYSCTRCGKKILLTRFLKGSSTCSKTCFEQVRKERERLSHRNHCRLCHRPTTPEQVKAWQKWAKATGLSRKPGRPARPPAPVPDPSPKTIAEPEPTVHPESTARKRSKSQSRKEV